MIKKIKKELREKADPEKAKKWQLFFKKKENLIGVSVPELRKIAKKYHELKEKDTLFLLKSSIHEERFLALLLMVEKYQEKKKEIFQLYLKNTQYINNWDLVDLSAEKIVGDYLFEKRKDVLYKLAESENLWERRIAIVSTHFFIKKDYFKDTLKIAEILLKDKEDLVQKAVGWMLREVGKKDEKLLENFLKKHYLKMPRVMLRYSIEKFPQSKRKRYLKT